MPLHQRNARSPMTSTLLPIVSLLNALHPLKASPPIIVTPLPIVILYLLYALYAQGVTSAAQHNVHMLAGKSPVCVYLGVALGLTNHLHPQGLVGSPKGFRNREPYEFARQDERQPGVPGSATLLRGCNFVAKVPNAQKKQQPMLLIFFA